MSVLKKICDDKLIHIEKQKLLVSQSSIEKKASYATATRGFAEKLREKASAEEYGLIAEVKKASPSKGLIRKDFNPPNIAKAYEKGGATCISVLTDELYFQGKDEYLIDIRNAVSLPVLRKDFILDIYQVFESRALGADCILLIMAALDDILAGEIESVAHSLDMDVLIEVHNENELERAMKLKSRFIGINNRNLKTMAVDISTTIKLSVLIPKDYTIVCESGISTNDDLNLISKSGVFCFLVGESLMRKDNVETATLRLLTT